MNGGTPGAESGDPLAAALAAGNGGNSGEIGGSDTTSISDMAGKILKTHFIRPGSYTQYAHDVRTTLYGRCNDVKTL